jgi:hypothetical protein
MAAANTNPIFSRVSSITASALIITAASVVYDISGTIGTDIYLAHTTDATNGSFIQRVRFKYVANGTTTSVGTVMRVWISSVATGTPTTSNASFWDEIALPATGTLTTTTVSPVYDMAFGIALPPSYSILCKTTVSQSASTGWQATVIAGAY